MEFAAEELRGDRSVVLSAVRQGSLALAFASEKLRRDRAVVLAAIRRDGRLSLLV